jgi:hypothetical protein
MQARVFREHGIASAHALPPFVPIGFIEDDFPPAPSGRGGPKAQALLAAIEKSVTAPWRVSVGSLQWIDGFLFLTLDSGGLWTQAREALLGAAALAEPGFFPAAEGFFFGCGDATESQRKSIRLEVLPLSFTSAAIVLVRLSSPAGVREFWREAYWESHAERPLRGRRKT